MSSARNTHTARRLGAWAIPAVAALAASFAFAPYSTGSTDPRPVPLSEARDARPPALQPAAARQAAAARLPRATPVPILMYHVLGDPPPGAPYPQLYVSDADFAGQMRWLALHGYTAVTLRSVWDHWHGRASLPPRPVVVSFDDGYRSVAHSAFPTLRERGWTGVLNLAVKNLQVRGGISERQVRRLIAGGWEIDAHTLTHPDLTTVDERQLTREVAGSRRALRRLFGIPVEFFCYPGGRFDARVIAAVRAAGFLAATTTIEGLASPAAPFELRRVRVSRGDGVSGFGATLTRFRSASALSGS
jgi:peptidoglycan/xylan/chitin deacetylase (PgdA/CDA1 family)